MLWRLLQNNCNRGKCLPVIERQYTGSIGWIVYKPQAPHSLSYKFSTSKEKRKSTNSIDGHHHNLNNSSSENETTSTSQTYDVIASTRMWVDTIIVGERLCPFVMPLKSSNTLRYIASKTTKIEHAVADVATQVQLLLPDHIIPLCTSTTASARLVKENVDIKKYLWEDDDDCDNDIEGMQFNTAELPDDDDSTDDSDIIERTSTSEMELSVDNETSSLNTIDSDRALWDILSEAQSHTRSIEEQQEVGDKEQTDRLVKVIEESQKTDSPYKFILSPDDLTPGMVKQHYEEVFDELAEPIRNIKPPLPSRPHGATLVMFDAPFVQDYRDFEELCEAVYRKILYEMDYYNILHIFLFHPKYVHTVYAVEKKFNAVDYVMRSPYPTILLVREIDMKAAYLSNVVRHIRQLSNRNKSRFLTQGAKVCIHRLDACYVPQATQTMDSCMGKAPKTK